MPGAVFRSREWKIAKRVHLPEDDVRAVLAEAARVPPDEKEERRAQSDGKGKRATRTVQPAALPPVKVRAREPMTALARAITKTLADRQESRFVLTIDRANGTAKIEPFPHPAEEAATDDFESAMADAFERGKTRSASILAGPEMLTSDQMAALLGVSRETVNRLRMRHELIGLQGAKRGFKYPDWQIVDGLPLKALPQLHALMQDSPWAVYRFLLEEHDALDGKSALACLGEGRTEDVLLVAEGLSWGNG